MSAIAEGASEGSADPRPRRAANNIYTRFMRWLSLRHPGMWRLRVDLLALAGIIGLLCMALTPPIVLGAWEKSTLRLIEDQNYWIEQEWKKWQESERNNQEIARLNGTAYEPTTAPIAPNDPDIEAYRHSRAYPASNYHGANASAFLVLLTGFSLFGLFWIYSILQPMRLRGVTNFQNRPGFLVLVLALLWFVLWPVLSMVAVELLSNVSTLKQKTLALAATMQGKDHHNIIDNLEYYFVVQNFWPAVLAIVCVASVLAIFVKSVLLSSLMRAIGSFFLAWGIAIGVFAVGFAVIGGPVLIAEKLDINFLSDIGSDTSLLGIILFLLFTYIVTLVAIWLVALLVFQARGNIWKRLGFIVLVLLAAAPAFWGTAWLAVSIGQLFPRNGPTGEVAGYILGGSAILAATGAYLMPHIVAIGGDLIHGARSRLTRPVLISCFWSAPVVIFGAAAVLLATLLNHNFYRGNTGQSDIIGGDATAYIVLGIAFILSLIAVELLSRLTKHISHLPEP